MEHHPSVGLQGVMEGGLVQGRPGLEEVSGGGRDFLTVSLPKGLQEKQELTLPWSLWTNVLRQTTW